MSNGYVVGFAGARDAYQVPLALQETNQLYALVTDIYLPHLPRVVGKRFPKLQGRHRDGLPARKTRSSLPAAWTTHLSWRFAPGRSRAHRAHLVRARDLLANTARKLAARSGSDLFLYAGYAHVAFTDPALKDARKILFMYHPHIERSAEILQHDARRYPQAGPSVAELEVDKADRSVDDELNAADLVVCASTFTASTCRAVGVPDEKLIVVPYGVDVDWDTPPEKPRDRWKRSEIEPARIALTARAWTWARFRKTIAARASGLVKGAHPTAAVDPR